MVIYQLFPVFWSSVCKAFVLRQNVLFTETKSIIIWQQCSLCKILKYRCHGWPSMNTRRNGSACQLKLILSVVLLHLLRKSCSVVATRSDTTLFARELLVTWSGRISRHAALYAEDGFVYIHVVHYILDRATYAFYLLGNFSVLH